MWNCPDQMRLVDFDKRRKCRRRHNNVAEDLHNAEEELSCVMIST